MQTTDFEDFHGIKIKRIGYFNNDDNDFPEYTIPIEQAKRDTALDVEKINYLTKHILTTKASFRGFSTCRCCNIHNGSEEYMIRVGQLSYVSIPAGYIHYIQNHFIELDPFIDKLYEWYKNKEYLPIMKKEKWRIGS